MGKRGPARTPKKILEIRGSQLAGRNPDEPEAKAGIPPPPRELNARARECWNRLSVQLDDMRILTTVDANALCLYCETWEAYCASTDMIDKYGYWHTVKGDKGQEVAKEFPFVRHAMKYADQLVRMGQEFGLTPSARTAIKTAGPKKKSSKSRFFARAEKGA